MVSDYCLSGGSLGWNIQSKQQSEIHLYINYEMKTGFDKSYISALKAESELQTRSLNTLVKRNEKRNWGDGRGTA